MPLSFQVRDFAGCERADIAVDKTIILAGRGHNGKTSTLSACAAAITGLTRPPAILKKNADELVRTGSKTASASVKMGNASMRIEWPSCEAIGAGQGEEMPFASPIAAGLASLLDMNDTERATALINYLHASPTIEDLLRAFQDQGLSEKVAAKVWDGIEKDQWDGAHAQALDVGRDAKRAWEKAAGGKYGSSKAANWLPNGWLPEWADAGADKLEQGVAEAKAAVETAIKAEAVGEDRIARLTEQVKGLPDLLKLRKERAKEMADAEARRDAAQKIISDTPPILELEDCSDCPACKAKLAVTPAGAGRYTLIEIPKDRDSAALEKVKGKVRQAKSDLADASSACNRANDAIRMVDEHIKIAEAAKKEHAATVEKLKGLGSSGLTVTDARAGLARAEEAAKGFGAKAEADRQAALVERMAKIVNILAPEGLRARKLRESVDAFNTSRLASLCDAAGWHAVTLDVEDLGFSLGGRRVLLSKSEQYMVRVVLQVACAIMDGSHCVIIDDAERLDAGDRQGFLDLLTEAREQSNGRLDALVGMMCTIKVVPDLGAYEMGSTLWMADGVAMPLAQAKKDAGL